MTEYDLFIMIFYTLDYYWDKHKGYDLGQFLSGMNPFWFDDEGSAVPYIYTEYCEFINGRTITLDNSFEVAKEYIANLNEDYISEAFAWVEETEWNKRCERFMNEKKGV